MSVQNRGFHNLASAIVYQAIEDYRNALKGRGYFGKSSQAVIRECERFFKSNWFIELTDLDGKFLIKRLRVFA